MLRNIFLAATALVALTSASVAADLGRGPPSAPVSPAPIFTWTGFYAGAYLGGVFGQTSAARVPDGLVLTPQTDGIAGGGLIGANYQLSSVVLGIEIDGGFLSASGSQTAVSFGTNSNGHTYTDKTELDSIARLRGRAGLAVDRALFFVAGGGSSVGRSVTFTDVTTGVDSVKISKTSTGWNIGGGVDYALTNNLVARVEYIYDTFGKETLGFLAIDSDINNRVVQTTVSTIRGALILKF